MQTNSDANASEKIVRSVLDACADCDTCRYLMDECCLLFPELYRLYDEEKEHGRLVGEDELQRLSELCTLCGLCPCPDIRTDIMRGKTERVRREGMPLRTRLLADVQRLGRLGERLPRTVNALLGLAPVDRMIKAIAGIHPQRCLPRVPEESFFAWARKKGLDRPSDRSRKVAYFAGCTAGYLFPEVARAAVRVIEENGVGVHVPPQQCCGMPTLLEGDGAATLERAGFNIANLLSCAKAGYDLVCACPTCGFLMKVLLKEGAYYSAGYQRSVSAGADEIKVPDAQAGRQSFVRLKKSMYDKILADNGYFADLDPLQRIALSDRIMDLGAYLSRLEREDRLNTRFGKLDSRVVYFAPCHQREQGIGSPYKKLLAAIPGLMVVPVGGALDCCGMGGSLGFKKEFHDASLDIGRRLMQKIIEADPSAVITDCLSCRLQFQHMLPYPVFHPLEMISSAYATAKVAKGES